uniref:Holin n=1 Tax=viral metagenome TaxID=1070528 RepID=A0A6M3IUI1_9ZZZZ
MEGLVNVVIGILSAAIVQLLKKIKLPSKFAPMICLVVAIVLVSVAKALGFQADVNTISQALLTALGISGATVLAYDQVKKLTEPK